MSELEARLRALEDRNAIIELTADYCHMARTGNVEGVVDLFCEDGVMESGDDFYEQGRERLLLAYREALTGLGPMPCVHNHQVKLDGDSATGCCSVEIRMVQAGEAITASGHYDDEFRRVEGNWKFAHRKLTLYHQVPHKRGWA